MFKSIAKGLLCAVTASLIINTAAFAFDKKFSFALSHFIMGGMYSSLGDVDQAIGEYKKSLKADSANTIIRLNLAANYIKKNQLDKSRDELKLATRLDPDAVEPHAILALLYSSQNKPDLAASEYEIALKKTSKLQPGNVEIYKTLGAFYLQQKKFSEAKTIYQLILQLSPKDPEAHFYLASIYDELNERAKAEEELKKSLELKPEYHEALNYLGYLYVEEDKNLDEAGKMIKRALEMEPDNGAYIDSLGWLYFKRGETSAAIKELEKAALLFEDPVIFDHLGDAYLKTGNSENAKINWRKSLKLDTKQDKVKEKLKKLETK